MVGEAEVVVAAEADDRAPVEIVADALALGDLGRGACQSLACLIRELFQEAAIQGGRHGA